MSVDHRPTDSTAVTGEGPLSGGAAGGISLMGMANVLLRNRWLLVFIPLLAVVAGVVPLFLKEREYTAEASLMPQEQDVRSGVAGLAAQFGISVGAASTGQSAAFYADFLTSRMLLGAVVDVEYARNGDTPGTVTYAELREIRAATPERRRELAIRSLRDHTAVRHSRETGVVSLAVTTTAPEVSRQIVERMLGLVNEFNLTTRQSQAAAERRFVESRLAEVRREMQEAEDRLQLFLQQNRQFRSPELQAEFERLQSEVSMRRQVFTSLAQAYEQARIDEVRNTPVITVIEAPSVPAYPDGRGIRRAATVAGLLGLLLAIFIAFGREAAQRAHRLEVDEYRQFAELRRKTLAELTWPLRVLRGRSRSDAKPSNAFIGADGR
jgi:uncharacterized protein involved in exopolysaccharide biosynthesis